MVIADNVAQVGISLPLALTDGSISQVSLACAGAGHIVAIPVIAACQGIHVIGVHHAVGAIKREREAWQQQVVLLITHAGNQAPAAILHTTIHSIHCGTSLYVALIGRSYNTKQ